MRFVNRVFPASVGEYFIHDCILSQDKKTYRCLCQLRKPEYIKFIQYKAFTDIPTKGFIKEESCIEINNAIDLIGARICFEEGGSWYVTSRDEEYYGEVMAQVFGPQDDLSWMDPQF